MKKIPVLLIVILFFQVIVSGQTAEKKNRFNFEDVEVLSIIKLMSKVTGKSFVFNNRILKGKKITILSDQEFTSEEAYRIFEAFLKINGLSTIVEGKIVRIVQSKDAKTEPTPVYDGQQKLDSSAFITRVIPVKNADVKALRSNLAPLVSRNAILLAISGLNAFIIRDTKENTSQFAKLVELFNQMTDPVLSVNLEIVPVRNANAAELSSLINKVFEPVVLKGNQPNKLKISADVRTNSIIIIGQPASLKKIKELVAKLDAKGQVDIENIRVLSLDINIIPINNSDARNIASLIGKIFAVSPNNVKNKAAKAPKVSVYAYERTNRLLVVAHPAILEKIKEVIKQLDTVNNTDHENIRILSLNLEIFPVKHADAGEIANLVTKLFSPPVSTNQKQPASAIKKLRIFSDRRTNSLILIGYPKTIAKVKEIVEQLDRDLETGELVNKGNIRVYKLQSGNAKSIAEVLQKVSKTFQEPKTNRKIPTRATSSNTDSVAIIPDIPTNSLVIYADSKSFDELERVLRELDVVRPQVFIQALIMEVKLDKSLELGVEWQTGIVEDVAGRESLITLGGVSSTSGPKPLSTGKSNSVIGVIGGPITFAGNDYASFETFIKAFEKDSAIDILSNPKILTLNNEEAEIKVAEIIPTTGGTKENPDTGVITKTVEYKEVGISLKITPQVNANNSIDLKIEETSSNVIDGYSNAFEDGAITTLNRSINTKVNVKNGQTVALGGLIHDDITEVVTKTPCLGDIPLLGWLFKAKSTRTKKTNLIIFLTPKVIRSGSDLAKHTKEAKEKYKSAKKGRFRIDVTNEFEIPTLKEEEIEKLEEERLEKEKLEKEQTEQSGEKEI